MFSGSGQYNRIRPDPTRPEVQPDPSRALLYTLEKKRFFSLTPQKGSVDVKKLPNELKC